jgi:hypothetical protein
MVQLRAANLTRAREVEFGRDGNGWRGWNETRVCFVIRFGPELQDRIAGTRQVAHKIRMNAKPGRHDLWANIFEFEIGQEICAIERIRDAHREGKRKIEVREVTRIKRALEPVVELLNAPRPIANIAMLRATIRCG